MHTPHLPPALLHALGAVVHHHAGAPGIEALPLTAHAVGPNDDEFACQAIEPEVPETEPEQVEGMPPQQPACSQQALLLHVEPCGEQQGEQLRGL